MQVVDWHAQVLVVALAINLMGDGHQGCGGPP